MQYYRMLGPGDSSVAASTSGSSAPGSSTPCSSEPSGSAQGERRTRPTDSACPPFGGGLAGKLLEVSAAPAKLAAVDARMLVEKALASAATRAGGGGSHGPAGKAGAPRSAGGPTAPRGGAGGDLAGPVRPSSTAGAENEAVLQELSRSTMRLTLTEEVRYRLGGRAACSSGLLGLCVEVGRKWPRAALHPWHVTGGSLSRRGWGSASLFLS